MERETFLHLLKIARLREEPEDYLHHFDEIVSLMRRIEEISFPEEEGEDFYNPLREDEARPFQGDATTVFPRKKDGYLEVPRNL